MFIFTKHRLSCLFIHNQPCSFPTLNMQGPRLSPKFRVKSFLASGQSLETHVDPQFYNAVKSGLVDLLGARSYFASRVLTPYCYTLGKDDTPSVTLKIVQQSTSDTNTFLWLRICQYFLVCISADIEIKLDEEGYVLPACHSEEVHKR